MRILAINSGSSSLKARLYEGQNVAASCLFEGEDFDCRTAIHQLVNRPDLHSLDAIGHRFVHGGDRRFAAELIDAQLMQQLEAIADLAPLHLPVALDVVRLTGEFLKVPQVACFDTAFHQTLPEISRRLPLPQHLNIRRYGFHGLSYQAVASALPDILGRESCGKVIVAHLGSGASLCLLDNLCSVDTTMGYTPAGGLTMATRSGDLDPGVLVELSRQMNSEELGRMVFHEMGVLALSSGESGNIQLLLQSNTEEARFAVNYFCRQVRSHIGAMAARAGGFDALVFTGGIGQNSAVVRDMICAPIKFLGVELDQQANNGGAVMIHKKNAGSKPVIVLAADEEGEIRRLTEAAVSRGQVER